ncbi:MAG: HPr kinase/phosphatase C-terminal domain-containing protein [Micropepsaceae bacterium]
MLVHATTIDLAGAGVMILGVSGAGKSELALRLIHEGALLVCDDQTELEALGASWIARAPEPIAGLLEVRGVGIVRVATKSQTTVRLVVKLTADAAERMPEPGTWCPPACQGPAIPAVLLQSGETSLPAKLRSALLSVLYQ